MAKCATCGFTAAKNAEEWCSACERAYIDKAGDVVYQWGSSAQ